MTRTGSTENWELSSIAYDEIARRYDLILEENRISRYMRSRSVEHLFRAFPPGSRLLEIGCGTGDEALDLATAGFEVIAIDPSPSMIEVARRKVILRGLQQRVRFLRTSARELSSLRSQLDPPLDGGYSSFSLTYEPDLRPVARELASLLRSDARFVASLPSKICLVEFLAAMGTGRPRYAGRRLRDWHNHKVGAYEVPIRSYTVRSFARAMAPYFQIERVEALPVLVPPPYMNRAYVRLGRATELLESIDEVVRRWPVLRQLGDHFVADLRRVR